MELRGNLRKNIFVVVGTLLKSRVVHTKIRPRLVFVACLSLVIRVILALFGTSTHTHTYEGNLLVVLFDDVLSRTFPLSPILAL